jgi:hypothetical protein
MRVLFYNLGLLRVDRVSNDGRVFLEPVIPLHSEDVEDILLGAYKKVFTLPDERVEQFYENPRALVLAIVDNLALVGRALLSTHGKMPLDALNEKSVQTRVHDILLHQFHHGRVRIAREFHIGEQEGYMDFMLAIKKAAKKGQKEEIAPLLNPEWRRQPSNRLPPGWEDPHGPVVEIKLAVGGLDHQAHMVDALRQAWSYRRKMGYNPKNVWIVGITCWWDEDYNKLTLKLCGGTFIGRPGKIPEEEEGKRPSEKTMESVILESDLKGKGVIWGGVTV